ncbi:MAG: 16S rRNA (guanine(966)-N(2))-methyltransferase RsmD [Thiotrichaceae bacterium]|nr:16S rRNA (guanine(966)-N(2))-methyltransferase RsmD [Thiotrichaceae bacterium]
MVRKKSQKSARKIKSHQTQPLRIIAGQWRGRKLHFASVQGLRPTPDRVRETLFNWLQGQLLGRRCLDLFAGSGALGFEAISRGAADLVLVESHREASTYLRENIRRLKAENIDLQAMDAFQYLQQCTQSFDLIFIDPPFSQHYWTEVLKMIRALKLLNNEALVYIEYPQGEDMALEGYEVMKQKKAGQVVSCLLKLT